MKIYVAGPMSGITDFNRAAFESAALHLRGEGHEVVIPHEVLQTDDWHEGMKADIAAMLKCDRVCFLPGWERSKGASLEFHIAAILEMDITQFVNGATNPMNREARVVSAWYCPEHKYNPPTNSGYALCPQCEIVAGNWGRE